jgi:hypothetical protein
MSLPKPSDLAMHDWLNLRPEERARALEDLRALADRHIGADHRRGRALHVMASYFALVTAERL